MQPMPPDTARGYCDLCECDLYLLDGVEYTNTHQVHPVHDEEAEYTDDDEFITDIDPDWLYELMRDNRE